MYMRVNCNTLSIHLTPRKPSYSVSFLHRIFLLSYPHTIILDIFDAFSHLFSPYFTTIHPHLTLFFMHNTLLCLLCRRNPHVLLLSPWAIFPISPPPGHILYLVWLLLQSMFLLPYFSCKFTGLSSPGESV